MDDQSRSHANVEKVIGLQQPPSANGRDDRAHRPLRHGTALETRFSLHPRWEAFTIILLIVTVFLLSHPYRGIRQDAVLYTAQALYNATPQNYVHDLFFEYGSQDKWTLYGRLFEHLIGWLGIYASNLIGLVVSLLLWWAGMWRVCKRVMPAPWHWVAMVFVAGMPSEYGDSFIFTYSETFLSARLPAEALTLWAISFALDRKKTAALLVAVLAMSLHPLMGAVGFAMVTLISFPRFSWERLFAAIALLFAASQFLTPASFALHPLDPAWRRLLNNEVSLLFPTKWDWFSLNRACWVLAVPFVVFATASTELRSFANASGNTLAIADIQARRLLWGRLGLMGLMGLGCATIVDLASHDAFLVALQVWRVQWLLTVMQWLGALTLVHREWRTRPALLWLFAVSWMALEIGGGIAALLFAAAVNHPRVMSLLTRPIGFLADLRPTHRVLLLILTLGAMVSWSLFQGGLYSARARTWQGTLVFNLPWIEALAHTRLMAALAAVLCAMKLISTCIHNPSRGSAHGPSLIHRPNGSAHTARTSTLLHLMLAALLAYAIVDINQESPTQKILATKLDNPALVPFAGYVAPGRMVYWDGPFESVTYPWMLMRTANYFSPEQSAGMIFHRQTTFEAMRRATVVMGEAGIQSIPSGESILFPTNISDAKPLTPNGIARVCRDPIVNYVVSSAHYAALSTDLTWRATPQKTFWLYDCSQVNARAPALPTLSPVGSAPSIDQHVGPLPRSP